VPPLRALVEAGHDVAIVVSRADKRRGRGSGTMPSPVKAAALELGLPVTERVDDVLDANVELGVVVAFGRLIKPHVLDKVPMINMHFSLLPRWRGAAPVERAILAGDHETGVAIMQLEEGLDTGPVYAVERVPIGEEETADELQHQLVEVGTRLLVAELERGLSEPTPQDGEPIYASKIDPDELQIDWARSADEIHRLIRLGRAWTTFRGKRLRILQAKRTASDAAPGELDGLIVGPGIELVEVQPEGKAPQPAGSWRNGAHPAAGERLGDQ
jgi:methionyl-tRNA formyltransferase